MTKDEKIARIRAIDAETRTLREERESLANAIAQENCPFVVGDVIEFRYGKIRARGVVRKVISSYGFNEYSLVVARTLKDGSMGICMTIRTYNEPKKVTA